MAKFTSLFTLIILSGCCAAPNTGPSRTAASTQPTSISVFVTSDGRFMSGNLQMEPSDLQLFAKEVGANRRIVLDGTNLPQLVQAQDEWRAAGFTDVVLAIGLGG